MIRINFFIQALVLAIVSAGCTTSPKDARSNAPTLELSSDRSVKLVAACIAEKWEDLYRFGTLNVRPTANGLSIVQQDQVLGGRDFPFIADIEERGTGSFTRYYNNAMSAKKIDQSVLECQK